MTRNVLADAAVALRHVLRRPGPAAASVACLAVGIGANASLFGVFSFFVLRPLPVHEPDRLVRPLHRLSGSAGALGRDFSFPEVRRLRSAERTLSGAAVFERFATTLRDAQGREPVVGQLVSGDYFRVLGVGMQLGPGFPEAGALLGRPGVAVLSDSLWRRRFGADPGVVGRTVHLNERPFEVAGVAAPGFRGTALGIDLGLFVPLASRVGLQGRPGWEEAENRAFEVLARLAPGSTRQAARAELQAIFDATAGVSEADRRELAVLPERAGLIAPDAPGLLDVATLAGLGGVALVLLVACANVGGLLLARAVSRRRELAIRLALGAGRGRIARLWLTESLVLAAPAVLLGLLLAHWATDAWTAFLPPLPVPVALDVAPDARAAAYAAGLGLLTALLASALPLRQSLRTDVVAALKGESGSSVAGSGRRLLEGVVVAQVAFGAVVLVLAGLFLGTLASVQRVDPGFAAERTLFVRVALDEQRYPPAEARRVQRELRQRVAALPGVRAAAWTSTAPMSGLERTRVRRGDAGPETAREILFGVSEPGLLGSLGVRLLEGHDFQAEEPTPVAIVGETLARGLWPGESALGRRLEVAAAGGPVEVVGVAADYTYVALMDPARGFVYLPASRHPRHRMWLSVLSTGDPARHAPDVRAIAADLDPLLLPHLATGTELVATDLWLPRTAALLAGGAGLTVLLLACVGVLGAMAFAVSRRTRELGIRIALGASRGEILGLVLGRAGRLLAVGAGFGVLMALGASRAISGLLFGVGAWDPVVYVAALIVLGAAGLAAAWVPARRAAAVEPSPALRAE